MPKRTNEFQKLVYYLKKHTIKNVTITESRELEDKLTGNKREVDIVVETNIGEHSILISFECIDRSRKADIAWVEQMYEKHRKLPTNLLVLISNLGFTKKALIYADKNNIKTSTFSLVTSVSAEETILKYSSLFIKLYELNVEAVKAHVIKNDKSVVIVNTIYDTKVCIGKKSKSIPIINIVSAIIKHQDLVKYFLKEGDEKYQYYIAGWKKDESTKSNLYLENIMTGELEEIFNIEIKGKVHFEVHEFATKGYKTKDLSILWGNSTFKDKNVYIIGTQDGNNKIDFSVF
jgi:hypothetical protein